MEIGKTGWKSFAEENKTLGGLTFGYKAPADHLALAGLPQANALLEVRNSDGTFCRLVNLINKEKEHFAAGQWLAILDSRPLVGKVNENFAAFETALTEKMGKSLPDNRFDEFVDWINPRAWRKNSGGYSMDISHLSPEKREALATDFAKNGGSVQDGQLSVMPPKWVKVLEFVWQTAEKRKLLYARDYRSSR